MILTESMNHLFANLAQGQERPVKRMEWCLQGLRVILHHRHRSGDRISAGLESFFFFGRSPAGLR